MYRTLVADDDFLVRSYLKTLDSWEKAGYEIVDDAEDGEEAYGFLQKEKIDVLVTDLTMPVMDGIELIRKIREENRDIYIIVLSCHDDFEYVKEAMRLGADEYVLKNSLDEDSLYDTLEKSARLIEKRREKSQEQARTRKLIHLGSHALKYYFFNGLISGMLKNQAGKDNGRRWKWNSIPIISVTDCWNVRRSFLGQKVNLRKWSILAQGFFAVFLIFPETAGHRLCSRD